MMYRAIVGLVAAILIVAASLSQAASAPATPVRGGTLRVALIGELPTIDWQFGTAAISSGFIASHMFEGLFTVDSKLRTRPMLAERWSTSPDRRTYTITLRRGVLFHHGREMDSADVVASLNRWGRTSTFGRVVFQSVDSVTATDSHTVVIRLKEPYSPLIDVLGWPAQSAVIYPKEVVEESPTTPVRRFIGTGPYRFVEHIRDRHYRLDRFDRYSSRSEDPDGMWGRKNAYLDTIFFHPVTDPAVRIAGLQRGDFHQVQAISSDEYERLRINPGIVAWLDPLPWWLYVKFNFRQPLFQNRKLRQAFNLALDKGEIMQGTMGPRQFWRLDPGLRVRELPMWTDAGEEIYMGKNPERARQLLQEAGYRGQPVRWITTMAVPPYGISAQIAKPMLERVGFVVDLQIMDFGTLQSRMFNTEGWDVGSGGIFPSADPSLIQPILPTWAGWYESREMQAFLTLMSRHADPKVRQQLWERAQRFFYMDLPAVKLGDYFWFHPHRREVRGFTGPFLLFHWNTWLER